MLAFTAIPAIQGQPRDSPGTVVRSLKVMVNAHSLMVRQGWPTTAALTCRSQGCQYVVIYFPHLHSSDRNKHYMNLMEIALSQAM
jgi:hypothetical protein